MLLLRTLGSSSGEGFSNGTSSSRRCGIGLGAALLLLHDLYVVLLFQFLLRVRAVYSSPSRACWMAPSPLRVMLHAKNEVSLAGNTYLVVDEAHATVLYGPGGRGWLQCLGWRSAFSLSCTRSASCPRRQMVSSGSLQPSRSAHVEAYITGKTVVPSDRMTRAPPDARP